MPLQTTTHPTSVELGIDTFIVDANGNVEGYDLFKEVSGWRIYIKRDEAEWVITSISKSMSANEVRKVYGGRSVYTPG